MKLYFAGDGSLIIAELNSDRTKVLATTLIPPDELEVNKLTGYLAKLSGKEVFDLVTTENFSCPDNLSLDTLSPYGCKNNPKQTGTEYQ